MPELNVEGCILLVGAVIRRAIQDAMCTATDSLSNLARCDAKEFLFKRERLETFLDTYHLKEVVNIGYIRDMAKDIIANRRSLGDDDVAFKLSQRGEEDEQ